jgi:hypothetical protein
VQVDQHEVLEQDHHQPERRREGRGEEKAPALPAGRAPGRPRGAKDTEIIGQVTARASLMDALLLTRPALTCSPRTSAYSSASQYTSNETTTETTSAAVDT